MDISLYMHLIIRPTAKYIVITVMSAIIVVGLIQHSKTVKRKRIGLFPVNQKKL